MEYKLVEEVVIDSCTGCEFRRDMYDCVRSKDIPECSWGFVYERVKQGYQIKEI